MKKYQRILIEALAPPFLGALIFAFTGSGSDTFADRAFYFIPFVLMAYWVCIIPSCLYALAMELWFWKGLGARFGLPGTVAFSAFLGCGAGLVPDFLIDGHQILSPYFMWIGCLVGLLIGFYVSRRKTSAA